MTNTPFNAHNITVEIDDETGAQIDVSGNANNVTIKESLRAGTYQVFKNAWDMKLDGGRGWSAEVQIFNSVDATEAFRDILMSWRSTRGARTVAFSIPNNSVGSDEWSGEAIIEGDIEVNGDRTSDDPMMTTIPLGGHGALTRAAIV